MKKEKDYKKVALIIISLFILIVSFVISSYFVLAINIPRDEFFDGEGCVVIKNCSFMNNLYENLSELRKQVVEREIKNKAAVCPETTINAKATNNLLSISTLVFFIGTVVFAFLYFWVCDK